jgi:hypothetical protein
MKVPLFTIVAIVEVEGGKEVEVEEEVEEKVELAVEVWRRRRRKRRRGGYKWDP